MVCNRLASHFSINELLLFCNWLKVDTSFFISYNDKFSMKIHFIYLFEYLAKYSPCTLNTGYSSGGGCFPD